MKHVIASVIYSSTEYSRFHMITGNRELSEGKIRKLTRHIWDGFNMLKECPVVVVEKADRLHIVDGQHRFWVSKTLKLPVFYVLTKDVALENIAKMNSCTEKWANKDYINCYAQQGNEHYLALQAFMELYQVPATTALPLLTRGLLTSDRGDENLSEALKNGTFEIKHATAATKVMNECERFRNFKQ